MSGIIQTSIALAIFMGGYGSCLLIRRNKKRECLKHFIEFGNRLIIITDSTEIKDANQKTLDFFGVASVAELRKKSRFVSRLFKEVVVDDMRHMEAIDWVTRIKPNQTIRVQAVRNNFTQTFLMHVSKVDDEYYMLEFQNISKLLAEKNNIEQSAEKDDLTQIYNRSKFNQMLLSVQRNAEIYKKPFCIILFDIDHFKKVNDTYGHDAGDKVLIQVATLVRHILRDSDLFARWGGEEFVILAESCALNDAYELANRLRSEIESFPFPIVKRLTCSFGVAEYQMGESLENLIKRADSALYQSKKEGRNRVTLAPIR